MTTPPKTIEEAVAYLAKWMDQFHRMKVELERADNVIRVVVTGHFVQVATEEEWGRMFADLRARGLHDHVETRAAVLQEVLYGG